MMYITLIYTHDISLCHARFRRINILKPVFKGGEQHIGTRGVPREVEVEKSIMPTPDPAQFRVQVNIILSFSSLFLFLSFTLMLCSTYWLS